MVGAPHGLQHRLGVPAGCCRFPAGYYGLVSKPSFAFPEMLGTCTKQSKMPKHTRGNFSATIYEQNLEYTQPQETRPKDDTSCKCSAVACPLGNNISWIVRTVVRNAPGQFCQPLRWSRTLADKRLALWSALIRLGLPGKAGMIATAMTADHRQEVKQVIKQWANTRSSVIWQECVNWVWETVCTCTTRLFAYTAHIPLCFWQTEHNRTDVATFRLERLRVFFSCPSFCNPFSLSKSTFQLWLLNVWTLDGVAQTGLKIHKPWVRATSKKNDGNVRCVARSLKEKVVFQDKINFMSNQIL